MYRTGQLASLGIALLAAASTAPLWAQESDEPRIMLVLDGSSSMWARVDGDTSKIEIAKQAIADLVGDWTSKMEFGITTYGHREEADCQDIETLLPVAEVNAEQVVTMVDGILPRGKTPLAAAMRQAADKLDYKNRPATILLVSDGIENCGQDPCQAAAELAADAKDLSINIIGFDMNNHQMGQLECIAGNANGRLVRADPSEFAETMDHSMAAAIENEEETATLSLRTTLVGKLVTEDIRYVVYRQGDDEQSPKIAEAYSFAPVLALPTGKFVVEAIRGQNAGALSKSIEVELREGNDAELEFRLAEFRPRGLKRRQTKDTP